MAVLVGDTDEDIKQTVRAITDLLYYSFGTEAIAELKKLKDSSKTDDWNGAIQEAINSIRKLSRVS